jgi:multiple sugar transport system substrate-binding protein
MTLLRVALVGGPMYDGLYSILEAVGGIDVEVVIHADHPTLNREVASRHAEVDVVSTHSKYAPSQRDWLQPLDALVDTSALSARAVDLCRFDGVLLCAPRNIDVRVLWWRSDRLDEAPDTWADLMASKTAFGFPGRESGLFGTFFELVVAHGGRLFDDQGAPSMVSDEALHAVDVLQRLAANAPSDLADWHYDQVDDALHSGRVDAAAAWPGGFGPLRASDAYRYLEPAAYLGGPAARVSYAGVHAWGITRACRDVRAAAALVERLTGARAAALDAQGGSIPAHVDAAATIEPADDKDARRLAITRDTIEHAMITYPPLVRFPEVEDAGWQAINRALRGETGAAEALERTQSAAERALDPHPG